MIGKILEDSDSESLSESLEECPTSDDVMQSIDYSVEIISKLKIIAQQAADLNEQLKRIEHLRGIEQALLSEERSSCVII